MFGEVRLSGWEDLQVGISIVSLAFVLVVDNLPRSELPAKHLFSLPPVDQLPRVLEPKVPPGISVRLGTHTHGVGYAPYSTLGNNAEGREPVVYASCFRIAVGVA